jgi:FkbM family methyltransferase
MLHLQQKMKVLFYKVFYHPYINFIFRNVIKGTNKLLGTNVIFSVSGKLRLRTPLNERVIIETNETCFVGTFIFWNGIKSYEYTEIFSKLIKKMNSFFDVGSNVGLFTVLAGVHNPKVKIDAFDPTESAFVYTNKNIRNNNLVNARVHKYALSDKKEKLTFHEVLRTKYLHVKYHLSGASSLVKDYITPGNSYEVNAISIDEFATENNIKNLDLLKIDAERAEALIIKGGMNTIKKFTPIILCEVRPDMLETIKKLTSELGYTMFHFREKRMYQVDLDTILSYDNDHDFMLVHKDKLNIVNEFITN